tara:strand:- start:1118 stop:1315 length:198 start_codon:yes stop_codon:yes gene_type:complete
MDNIYITQRWVSVSLDWDEVQNIIEAFFVAENEMLATPSMTNLYKQFITLREMNTLKGEQEHGHS